MTERDFLARATSALPPAIGSALGAALRSGEFVIGACSYESALAVCPMAAAAITAGVWEDGAVMAGAMEWGTPDRPSDPVEEFAAWFDLCAESDGLDQALSVVRTALSVGCDTVLVGVAA